MFFKKFFNRNNCRHEPTADVSSDRKWIVRGISNGGSFVTATIPAPTAAEAKRKALTSVFYDARGYLGDNNGLNWETNFRCVCSVIPEH